MNEHAPLDPAAFDPARLEDDPDYALAPFGGERPPAPAWYEALRERRPERLRVEVEGAGIEVLAWGERGRPGVMLVHGNRAHAGWWGPVAPLLAEDYRVASVSLSGMGNSDWREHYAIDQQAREIFAAMDVAGLGEGGPRPILAAHSFGGICAAEAARQRGDDLGGLVFVDTFLVPPRDRPHYKPPRQGRPYASRAEALARFRLSPSQPGNNPWILHDVAAEALVQDEDGAWRWAFDPGFGSDLAFVDPWRVVTDPPCRLALVYGEHSALATPAMVARQRAAAPPGTPFVAIPEAWHHVMFDQPLALVAALRALVATWSGAG